MRIDIATLFPEMCERVLDESIIGRARKKGLFTVCCHQIRDYTTSKHGRVDDYPYGGSKGMVMQADPIYRCYEHICEEVGEKPYTIYLSPKGRVLTQEFAVELKESHPNLLLICGHYEGVDQRLIDEIVDEEVSVGDYVLTGGELPALILADCLLRMEEGVLSAEECFQNESHYDHLLEHPQYTRPEVWHGQAVPEVLLSGHHKNIEEWRRAESMRITREKRPDLFDKATLTAKDKLILKRLTQSEKED